MICRFYVRCLFFLCVSRVIGKNHLGLVIAFKILSLLLDDSLRPSLL